MRSVQKEQEQRRREVRWILPLLFVLFIGLILEFRVYELASKLPVPQFVSFLGLIHFNVILFFIICYLSFRNLSKTFIERRLGIITRTFQSKLVVSFLSFALLPTLFLFLVSIFYLNSNLNRWFSGKSQMLTQEIINLSQASLERETQSSYKDVAGFIKANESVVMGHAEEPNNAVFCSELDSSKMSEFFYMIYNLGLDVEDEKKLQVVTKEGESCYLIDLNLVKKLKFPEGQIYFRDVFIKLNEPTLVIGQVYGNSSVFKFTSIKDIWVDASSYGVVENEKKLFGHILDVVRTLYGSLLLVVLGFVFLGGIWFAVYFSRQMSRSVEKMLKATEGVNKGDLKLIEFKTGTTEFDQLVQSYNKMIQNLKASRMDEQDAKSQLEDALEELNLKNKSVLNILEAINSRILIINKDTEIIDANLKMRNFLGWSLLTRVSDLEMSVDLKETLKELVKDLSLLNEDNVYGEKPLLIKGVELPILVYGAKVADPNNINEDIYIFTFQDLSFLADSERSKAWQDVATRLAHEIKNPLTPIKLHMERLIKKGDNLGSEEREKSFRQVLVEVDGIKTLVNKFRKSAQSSMMNFQKMNADHFFRELAEIYKVSVEDRIIEFLIPEERAEFIGDQNALKRVLMNFIDNALEVQEVAARPKKIQVGIEVMSEIKKIQLWVRDNGVGVDKEIQTRLFEAFVSHKAGGTGLGLSICKKTAHLHGGFVGFKTGSDGSLFYIEIPIGDV